MKRCALVATIALAALPTELAHAATAAIDSGVLRVTSGSANEDLRLLPSDGAYLVRSRSSRPALHAGTGCATSRPRELRCQGQVASVDVKLGNAAFNALQTQSLAVPINVTGGSGADLILIGSSPASRYGTSAGATVSGGPGRDSIIFVGLPGVPYVGDGGPGDDNLEGMRVDGGAPASFTLRGSTGNDRLRGDTGADELDGGPGRDQLQGNGGADTLRGGDGTDTATFVAPPPDQPRLSVTLDGERNDGQPGDNALVGTDVENITFVSPFEGGPVPGGNTLIGDDGPNVLVGAGIVRGMGGDDVVTGAAAEGNELDGGDGNDRVYAQVRDEAIQYVAKDKISCGPGDDTAFVDRLVPRPADCEHFNIGMHVASAIGRVNGDGLATIRVSCDDIVPCRFGGLLIHYKKHLAGSTGSARLTIAPGQAALGRVLLAPWLALRLRRHAVVVTALPVAWGFEPLGAATVGFPRAIRLSQIR
jgi:hypothetical protein